MPPSWARSNDMAWHIGLLVALCLLCGRACAADENEPVADNEMAPQASDVPQTAKATMELPKATKPLFKLSERRRPAAASDREPEFHPHGRHYPRRNGWEEQRLISGQPDEWFARILRKEPDDLTLDEVEDMTIDERTDYVGRWIFHHREHHSNVVRHLLRLEQLGRMYHRKRPGEDDEHEPLHDHPDAPFHTVSRVKQQGQEREVPDEDRRMSSPRWHLDGERERIEADPVWTRRTQRKRPLPKNVFVPVEVAEVAASDVDGAEEAGANASDANATAPKKRVVVKSLEEATKVVPEYDPKHTTSTVKRVPTVKRVSRAERSNRRRQLHRELSEEERLVEWMKDDPGRCLTAAASFCDGSNSRYAEFLDCTLSNVHKFGEHDAYCAEEVPFYAPCRHDMLTHCPDRNSVDLTNCMLSLAGDAADAIVDRGVDALAEDIAAGRYALGGASALTPECLASEYMETMVMFRPPESATANGGLTEAQRKILFKYQHFWLAQHDDPATAADDGVDPEAYASKFEIVSSDEL